MSNTETWKNDGVSGGVGGRIGGVCEGGERSLMVVCSHVGCVLGEN